MHGHGRGKAQKLQSAWLGAECLHRGGTRLRSPWERLEFWCRIAPLSAPSPPSPLLLLAARTYTYTYTYILAYLP